MNSDNRAALTVVRVLKWVVSALTLFVVAFLLVIVVNEANHDNRDAAGAIGQTIAGGLIVLIPALLVWSILMLPLWLIGGHLRRQQEAPTWGPQQQWQQAPPGQAPQWGPPPQ